MSIGTKKQSDQIGRFLKFLVTKFLTKVAQIISNFLGFFEQPHSYVKTDVATSWVFSETFGLLVTSTSGHTAKKISAFKNSRNKKVCERDRQQIRQT